MRVISGSAKGIKLNAPENDLIRPTLDRYKEDIFNIINVDVYAAKFLDLFAGTGSMGIEALSRGAKEVVFVDKAGKSIDIIKSNLKKSKLIENNRILQYDYIRAIKSLKGEVFDFIYLDPPFNKDIEIKVIEALLEGELLSDSTKIICESTVDVDFSSIEDLGLEVYREKAYRYCKFTFIKRSRA